MSPGGSERTTRVTMKDVARFAGVSQSTVSFVLNERVDIHVAAETRERILNAARELRYQPNRAAQSLRSNRPYTVGVIASHIVAEPNAGLLISGIQFAVQEAGQVCVVLEVGELPDHGEATIKDLVRGGVAGLIYASPFPQPIDRVDVGSDLRTVYVNCWPASGEEAAVVLADEYQGGRDAAAATFAAGHRRVAFLGGPAEDYACRERERGLDDAATAVGIGPNSIRREHGNYQVASGYELAERVLREGHVTALICGNDRMALGALLATRAAGLECPRDISIVGFDDQSELASELHPALSTVALPSVQMGLRAAELLNDRKAPIGRILVPCRYIARVSLSAPH